MSNLKPCPFCAWRTIDSAPRDGSVLLYWPETSTLLERVSIGSANKHGPHQRPTHWQPLPDPPSPLSTGLDAEGSAEGGGEDDLRKAGAVMLADYQTSERHHPDYVLVSLAAFEAMRVALAKVETEGL